MISSGCLDFLLQGFLYIYDGINTDDSLSYKASFCGSVYDDPTLNNIDIHSGYATVVYYGNSTGKSLYSQYYRSCAHVIY